MFKKLKYRIDRDGRAEAQRKTGYSLSTIRSIDLAQDYDSWRTNRKTVAKATKKQPTAPATSKEAPRVGVKPLRMNPAVKSVQRRVSPPQRPDEYVTKEQVEVVVANLRKEIMRELTEIRDSDDEAFTAIVEKIKTIEKQIEDEATLRSVYLDVEPKSFWQRLKGKF